MTGGHFLLILVSPPIDPVDMSQQTESDEAPFAPSALETAANDEVVSRRYLPSRRRRLLQRFDDYEC